MRILQGEWSVWRGVTLIVLFVYLLSFGSFMSRLMTLDPGYLERKHDRVPSLESSLLFARTPVDQQPENTQHVPQSKSTSKSTVRKQGQVPGYLNLSTRYSPSATKEEKFPKHSSAKFKPEMKTRKAEVTNAESVVVKSRTEAKPIERPKVEQSSETTSGDLVVNPHPFRYVINAETLCAEAGADAGGADVFVVVYVHSAPSHYKRRMVIRQTWGDAKQYTDNIRVVFFAGSGSSSGVERALAFEAEQYGDIVQEDFYDSYRNLTYKGIAALKWISHFCSEAKFVLKTDDDMFVNMFTLIRHLKRLQETRRRRRRGRTGAVDHLLMCLVWHNMPVLRSGKWKVSRSDWKADFYPAYCSGSAFVMSIDVAVALHSVSYFVPFFWVDDVYVTGLLPLKLGTIRHSQFMSAYILNGKALEEKFSGAQWYRYVFCHVHDLSAMHTVWKKVVAIETGELVPPVRFLIPQTNSSSLH